MKQKTFISDINREFYDFRYEEKDSFRVQAGLDPAVVEEISSEKNDPEWMHDFREKP